MGLDDLIPADQPRRDDRSMTLMSCVVIDNASGLNDLVRVRLNVDKDIYVPPMRYMPRGRIGADPSNIFPQKGDLGLVAFDENNTPYLIAWWEG